MLIHHATVPLLQVEAQTSWTQAMEQKYSISVAVGKASDGFRYWVTIRYESEANGKAYEAKCELMGNSVDSSPIVSPEELRFSNIKREGESSQVVSIREAARADLGNIRVYSDHPAIKATVLRAPNKMGFPEHDDKS